MRKTIILVLLLTVPVFQGCLGFGGDDSSADNERLTKQSAQVSETTGGIQGIVTDNAVQPVPDAKVTIVELEESVFTDTDGSYAFSEVPPGEYTLTINATKFVPASQSTDVRANSVSIIDFVLVHLATEEAYMTPLEQSGFLECGHQVGWETRDTTAPLIKPADDAVNNTTGINPNLANQYGLTWFFFGLATCAIPNVVIENSTNDRFLFNFELDPPVETLVYEMRWESSGAMSAWLSTVVEIQGFSNNDRATFYEENGESPLQSRVDKERFIEVSDYLSQSCEDGNSDACIGPWDEGWPLQVRVFAAWECVSETAGACATTQQGFTHYMFGFYNAPAPAGFTVTDN